MDELIQILQIQIYNEIIDKYNQNALDFKMLEGATITNINKNGITFKYPNEKYEKTVYLEILKNHKLLYLTEDNSKTSIALRDKNIAYNTPYNEENNPLNDLLNKTITSVGLKWHPISEHTDQPNQFTSSLFLMSSENMQYRLFLYGTQDEIKVIKLKSDTNKINEYFTL